jgi:putative transposase
MPRPIRIDYQGAWHHVMNRGAGHNTIFHDTLDRVVFLELLADAASEHGIAIHAYCLMGNHFHLLLQNAGGSISDCMRVLTGRFTRRVNSLANRDGPIFRGRYRSVEVVSDGHRLLVSRYIHLNPVVAGLCPTAEAWPWSSARFYLGRSAAPGWLDCTPILDTFVGTTDNYESFVSAGVDPLTDAFYARERLDKVFEPGCGANRLRWEGKV